MSLADHFKTVRHMENVRANLQNVKSLIEKEGRNHHENKIENVEASKYLQNNDSWGESKKAKLDANSFGFRSI